MTRITRRSQRLQIVRRSLLLALHLCACSDSGLGIPGGGTPLPAGGLPASQTLEGGAQIRVSQAGFTKLTSVVPSTLSDSVSQGMCVPEQSTLGSSLCYTNQGACTPGCSFDLAVPAGGVVLSVTNANTINVKIDASASGAVRIDHPFFSACTVDLSIDDLSADADVAVSIDPATGALQARLDRINDSNASGIHFSGCSQIAELASLMTPLLDSVVGTWIVDAVTPALDTAINELVPAPSELAASIDLPALAFTGLAASNGSMVETRVGPGGYVQLQNGGLSLGVVTGFNSDADPQTRSTGLISEPAACVAGLTAPDLSLPPLALATTSRGTFVLPPADSFDGSPDPASDLMVGISQAALDLAGHHVVASGGMCLDVGTDRVAFLRRDVLDDLLGVPFAAADAELRLRVRPQHAIHFTVGTGADPSPHLAAALDALEIDVDSVTAGSATPVVTLRADVSIASQLVTRRDAGAPVRLETTRAGIDVANPSVQVFDARYAGLNAAALDALASTLVDVVFSSLGADAGTASVADFAGLPLGDVAVTRVSTASDAFLAVTASLAATPPSIHPPAPTPQSPSTTVVLPTPVALRAGLVAGDDAALPTVHVTLPTSDGGRALEHAWRTAGGVWHPYVATGDLVIRDRSFAWQGERTLELRSRVVGDDTTTSAIGSTTVDIDYAPPTLFADQRLFGTDLVVPTRDALSSALEWAMGRVGEDAPVTPWTTDPNLDKSTALSLGDDIVVYARDAAGNVAHATVHLVPEAGAAAAAAVACAALGFVRRRAT